MNYRTARHYKGKKSQITMFVLLGLILLIVVAILLFLKESLEPRRWGIQEILHELEVGRIKNHITDCMSDIGFEAVRHIGNNGGNIYVIQGGQIPFENMVLGNDYLNYALMDDNYPVGYGLKKNLQCSQVDYSTSGYPFPDVPFSELSIIYAGNCSYISGTGASAYDGFFGQSVMSKLCYVTRETSCLSYAKGLILGFTIQKQLEDYVIERLPYCTDFSSFAERMGVVDIVPEDDPIVEADIQAARIILVVKYPVKIIFQNNDPISTILNYQAVLNVRLGGLYHFAYHVLSRDSKRIDWSVKTDYISSYYWMTGFRVSKLNNPCPDCPDPYNQDDILEFIDEKSFVFGRPLTFRVAVENRRPAIDFIPSFTVEVDDSAINMPFSAYDPDDETLRYYFLSFGQGAPVCSGGDPSGDVFIPSSDVVSGEAGFNLGGANGWCENDPRVLASLPYSTVWAPIGLQDIGRHEVALLVIDDSGLFDYQPFWLNITSSLYSSGACYAECMAGGDGEEACQHVCAIAADQCGFECGGDFHGNPRFDGLSANDCLSCVQAFQQPIMPYHERYIHPDCAVYSQADCINNMPDCFWVKESWAGGFIESCLNDYDLANVNQPAHIIES